MTENKRFRMTETEFIFMVLDNEKALSRKEIVDKLNNLTDENEDLKKEIERITKDKENWAFISDCSVQVMNEEEKFKEDYLRIATNNLKKLQEENEQLKSTIKEVTELLSDEVDLFSDKATEHDINAYVELKEFDNKDAFYMATATKKAIRMLKELENEEYS